MEAAYQFLVHQCRSDRLIPTAPMLSLPARLNVELLNLAPPFNKAVLGIAWVYFDTTVLTGIKYSGSSRDLTG